MSLDLQGIICLCGNDGTGKSTLAKLIPMLSPKFHVIERSSPQPLSYFESLRQEIKKIDFLTYRYSFEEERGNFEPSSSITTSEGDELPVYWIMLHLEPQEIFQRISQRQDMGIYESKKCVEYYSYVYLELAAYYGMAVVESKGTSHQNATDILELINSGAMQEIQKVNLKKLSLETINQLNVENQIIEKLTNDDVRKIVCKEIVKQLEDDQAIHHFYFPQIEKVLAGINGQLNWKLCYQLAARWILKHSSVTKNILGQLQIIQSQGDTNISIQLSSPSFIFFTEGESKLIFEIKSKNYIVEKHFASKIWILLKSTIYSHTKQHTGQIENLGKVRAVGSNLFLQMLRRNNLKHAYVAINKEGIIFSRKIETNNVEIVFKKEFVGTDKHSYSLLETHTELVAQQNKYKCGIYVRFDWRNPNHFLVNYPSCMLNLNSYYYLIEKSMGKENFFNEFLIHQKIRPWGDKCISEDVIANYIKTEKVKKAVLSLYCAFSYYCKRVGLEIIDGCFMLDSNGETVWSEINPDCMRVKKLQLNSMRENYDKDIWRVGGSDSKSKIIEKWTLFNKLFIEYFVCNRFHETELLNTTPLSYPRNEEAARLLRDHFGSMKSQYIKALKELSVCTQKHKEIIGTIDISEGKPMLVKSSQLSENHSGSSLEQAHNYIRLLPKVILVDLDSALGRQNNNLKAIKSIVKKANSNIYGVGGGIRTKQALFFYLYELLIPKIILSTNLELLNDLPKDIISERIIVQLSINENNEILTHGRRVNTHQNVTNKMIELSRLGVRIISLTFNHKQGHLSGIPRQQFRDIMFKVPGSIKKVIIAGGISTLNDLEYIWGFQKAVPQLGSAIWKNKISISDICNQIINFNSDGLCPAIITDTSEKLLGQVFMNKEAIEMTCQKRELYRFSRKLGRLIKKGEQSGNTQKIVAFRLDCDNDCLNIIVQESIKPFCHQECQSCFDFECQHKSQNIISLQNHLLRKKETGSGYSKRMQSNQNLALSKFMQQSYEFSLSKNRIVEEGADLIAHMLMYLNTKGIPFQDIMRELEVRSTIIKPKLDSIQNETKKIVYLGVMGGKHYEKIDKVMLFSLGIRVIRATNRSLKLTFTIENQQKYDKYFKGLNLKLIGIKSKDMASLLNQSYISFCFNYSIMMQNYPQIWIEHFREPISEIKLVLLERNNKPVDPFTWTPSNKGRIASEYPRSVVNYLSQLGIDEDCYSIVQVGGGTESFLELDNFDYCDAIVESGRTIEDNDLKIVKVLAQKIQAAFYTLIQ